MPNDPTSVLDRINRDITRTYLHGARNGGLPMMVATGQQIEVSVPPNGANMPFQFLLEGIPTPFTVTVPNGQAAQTDSDMAAALADPAHYLTLAADGNLPLWTCNARPYTLTSPPNIQDCVDVSIGGNTFVAVSLPSPVLEAVEETSGSFVSLFLHDADDPTQDKPVPAEDWQPGIIVRFPLKPVPSSATPGTVIFEISGTPQGDRYFLDQLGLLPGQKPGATVTGIALTLETVTPQKDPVRAAISNWTIARSNLTGQARSNSAEANVEMLLATSAGDGLPYVALSDDADGEDAIRLLQMASIANSGGYYLRAQTTVTAPTNLVLAVMLAPTADTTPSTDPLYDVESALLSVAANAIVFAGAPASFPNVIRFNGAAHVQVQPATKPGCLLVGWTRQEVAPDNYTSDVQRFAYGAMSIVEYSASDATGNNFCTFEQCIPISSGDQPSGQSIPSASAASPATERALSNKSNDHHTGDTRVLRLRPRSHAAAKAAPQDDPTQATRYYRTSIKCFSDPTAPWSRLTDTNRSLISITPGLRLVYGSRIPLPNPPVFKRRLFYTDALLRPAEWPGVTFALYPTGTPGNASLTLEMAYHVLQSNSDNTANVLPDCSGRIAQLEALRIQLAGAGDNDVTVTFSAAPLAASTQLPIALLVAAVTNWKAAETANAALTSDSARTNPPATLFTFRILDAPESSTYSPFDPRLVVARPAARCPQQPSDLPDGALGNFILADISSAWSRVPLQQAATTVPANPPAPNPSTQAAFLDVAQAFQKVITNAKVAYLRDQDNLHELWLIPNACFPAADLQGPWGFATPRPLNNQLGYEVFSAPDFTKLCDGSTKCWTNAPQTIDYPISQVTVTEQDYDLLGRAAFRFLQQQTTDVTQLTDPANAVTMRQLIATREQIADTLSQFSGSDDWLVPLYADAAAASNLDPTAITRVTKDAFRQDLSAFYSLSTILQLPLIAPTVSGIQLFEGTVSPAFAPPAAGTTPKLPTFSDVLIGAGEKKATILYDLPGSAKATDASALMSLQVSFSHVQIPVEDGFPSAPDFNQGRWLRLANPYSLTAWNVSNALAPGGANSLQIPVADRNYPDKPILQQTLPLQTPAPDKLTSQNVSLLTSWGWQLTLGLVEVDDGDSVRVQVFYIPLPPIARKMNAAALAQDWSPDSLLACLYVFTTLQANWALIPTLRPNLLPAGFVVQSPIAVLLALTESLSTFLTDGPAALVSTTAQAVTQTSDALDATYKAPNPPQQPDYIYAVTAVGPSIASLPVFTPPDPALPGASGAVLTAAAGGGNHLSLVGAAPLRSCRMSLTLSRNPQFNTPLQYRRAPVESPIDVFALNTFDTPMTYDMSAAPADLKGALDTFFQELIAGSVLAPAAAANLAVEVSTSLAWTKGPLKVNDNFLLLPADLVAESYASASAISAKIYEACQQVLGTATTAPPETDLASIRLRIKLTEDLPVAPATFTPRTLLEIIQLDFPLVLRDNP